RLSDLERRRQACQRLTIANDAPPASLRPPNDAHRPRGPRSREGRMIHTVLSVSFALWLVTQTFPPGADAATVIAGIVRTQSGQPLSGLVLLEKGEIHNNRWDRGTLVDASGRFRIELAEGGQYGLHAYSSGYIYKPNAVKVESDKTLEVEVVLVPEPTRANDPVIKRVDFPTSRSRRASSVRMLMEAIAVVIMAKAPRAGEVKTRLCPPLSLADASELYRRFLLDKIDQVRALRTASPAIAYTPAEARAFFEEIAPGFVLVPQRGADLGDRLANSLGELLDQGYRGALAIDSDTPTLPLGFLEQGLDLLTTPEVDVVLGPTEDGGYYLIGLRTVYRELFEAMAWSTSRVFPETIRRADAKGLRVAC